jgi:predicted PurR-regulated permease PerM
MQQIRVDNDTIIRTILLVALATALIWLAYLLRRELAWFFGAAFLAVALNPAVEWLAKRVTKNKRLPAAIILVIFIAIAVALLVYSFVPSLAKQTIDLVNSAPHYLDQLQHGDSQVAIFIRDYHVLDQLHQQSSAILQSLSGVSGSVISAFGGLFSGVAAVLTVLALTFLMMLEGPSWVDSFWNSLPERVAKRHRLVVGRMYATVTGYVTGNLLTSLVAAVVVAAMLAILRVPFAIPLGILVGLFDLIPLIGATIGAVVVVVVALFTSLTAGVAMAIFFIVYQQVENHLLQPLVYSRTIRMSPLLVLMSALAGAGLGGILGALVAIPIGASVRIAWEEYVLSPRKRPTRENKQV